jgi:hypothetical protein
VATVAVIIEFVPITVLRFWNYWNIIINSTAACIAAILPSVRRERERQKEK